MKHSTKSAIRMNINVIIPILLMTWLAYSSPQANSTHQPNLSSTEKNHSFFNMTLTETRFISSTVYLPTLENYALPLYHENFSILNQGLPWQSQGDQCTSSYQNGYYQITAQAPENFRGVCWASAPDNLNNQATKWELPFFESGAAEVSVYHHSGTSNGEMGLYIKGKDMQKSGEGELDFVKRNSYILRIWPNPQEDINKDYNFFDYCENGGGWWELRRTEKGHEETLRFKGVAENNYDRPEFEKGCETAIKQGMGPNSTNVLRLEYEEKENILTAYINGIKIYTFIETSEFEGVGTGVFVRTATNQDMTIRVDDFKVYK